MQNSDTIHNILIVEDNITLAKLIHKKLSKRKNYSIQISTRISNARKIINNNYFDLICLDIALPDGNGIDFCKEIKTNPSSENTKVIFITQKTSIQNRIDALETGADDYLPKPFHPDELEVRVRKTLGLTNQNKTSIKYKNMILDVTNMLLIYEKYELPLTKTDLLLIQYLFKHEGYANLELLSLFLSSKKLKPVNNQSVIVSIKRLRDKLEKTTGNPFIKTKYGSGYYIP